ncbi:hypothetical protein [Photobacterium damselae]|uniref:hypothetical protein n=1 Tax=Photobacterium damselae TaxID=38293 RepID=UPI001F219F2E|nr:hypothetical protein [Photobacterium damselae]UKA04819.1 hypothetical protein IHC89_21490 [Photobacterium damselae subsp. damselae]
MDNREFKSILKYDRQCSLNPSLELSLDLLMEKEVSGDNSLYESWVDQPESKEFCDIIRDLSLQDVLSPLLKVYLFDLTRYQAESSLIAELYLMSLAECVSENEIIDVIDISSFDNIMDGKYPSKDCLETAVKDFKKFKKESPKGFHNVVLAAASKFVIKRGDYYSKEIVLVDNCHLGVNMLAAIGALQDAGWDVYPCHEQEDCGEGFIDENGAFHNRTEAMKIVKSSGQLFNGEYTLPEDKLDSSCIRHFPANKPLSGFLQDLDQSETDVESFSVRVSKDVLPQLESHKARVAKMMGTESISMEMLMNVALSVLDMVTDLGENELCVLNRERMEVQRLRLPQLDCGDN